MSPAPRNPLPFVLTFGFALGLGFGWLVFSSAEAPTAATRPAVTAPEPHDLPRDAGSLAGVEEMFQRWGGYAVWENDLTEFAAWSPRRQRHADCYEVLRRDGRFYFRRIPALTRPRIDHGIRADLSLAFTEPQWMRDLFYRNHPDYDPAKEPVVELPPKAPQRYAPDTSPTRQPLAGEDQLTPGAGKD